MGVGTRLVFNLKMKLMGIFKLVSFLIIGSSIVLSLVLSHDRNNKCAYMVSSAYEYIRIHSLSALDESYPPVLII